MLVNDDLSRDNSMSNTFKEEKPGWLASQMFHSFGVMTPPGGVPGNRSVLGPPCSGTLFTEHVRFHISQVQFTEFTEYKTTWQFSLKETTWVNKMCAGGSLEPEPVGPILLNNRKNNICKHNRRWGEWRRSFSVLRDHSVFIKYLHTNTNTVVFSTDCTGGDRVQSQCTEGIRWGGGQKVPKSKSYLRIPSQVNTALPQGGRQLLELRN